jgi:hypothetical protein
LVRVARANWANSSVNQTIYAAYPRHLGEMTRAQFTASATAAFSPQSLNWQDFLQLLTAPFRPSQWLPRFVKMAALQIKQHLK